MKTHVLAWVLTVIVLASTVPEQAVPQEDPGGGSETPLLDSWEETLLYGIDSEVLEVIKQLTSRGETALNGQMLRLLKETLNPAVRVAILDHFREQQAEIAADVANELLREYEDLSSELIMALIRYLTSIGSQRSFDLIMELTNHFDQSVGLAAVRGLGTDSFGAGRRRAISEHLIEKLENRELDVNMRAEAVLALGGVGSAEAVDLLIGILEDDFEEKIVRLYAADALGRIGDERAVPALRRAFTRNDALLRAYAAAALSEFETEEVVDVLIQGLKDENWKVRVTSAQGLARRKANRALDILVYKARKDPVDDVRVEACRAIGEIGGRRSLSMLRELYGDPFTAIDVRLTCLDVLVEKDISGSVGVIEEVAKRNLDKEIFQTWILERTAKRLASVRSPALERVFALLLTSADAAVRVHAVRGIAHNGFSGLGGEIRRLSEEDPHAGVRKEAAAALDSL